MTGFKRGVFEGKRNAKPSWAIGERAILTGKKIITSLVLLRKRNHIADKISGERGLGLPDDRAVLAI